MRRSSRKYLHQNIILLYFFRTYVLHVQIPIFLADKLWDFLFTLESINNVYYKFVSPLHLLHYGKYDNVL